MTLARTLLTVESEGFWAYVLLLNEVVDVESKLRSPCM